MPLAQDIYDTLVKDPDLDIGESQTREEAAKTEADFRARQYVNNVKALSLATEPLEKISSVKALLQHVSSLSKTIVSGSISIAQNILKGIIPSEAVQDLVQENADHHFKSLPNLDEKTQKFVDSYIQTQKGQPNAKNAEAFADYLEAGGTVDTLLNAHTSEHPLAQEAMQAVGLSYYSGEETSFFVTLKQHLAKVTDETGEPMFPIPHKDFKPESSKLGEKKGVDYGKNSSIALNSTASIDSVNSALGRQNSPYSVAFGGSNKLKLVDKNGADLSESNIHNPFPSVTHGRLFQSMVAFKAPMAGEEKTGHFDTSNLSQFSVADMLNAIHWISTQETPTQAKEVETANEEAAKLTQEATNDDKEMYKKEEEISSIVNDAPSTGTKTTGIHPNLSKPHVLIHSWGKVMHKGTEHEYTIGSKNPKVNEHSHVPMAYNHQI